MDDVIKVLLQLGGGWLGGNAASEQAKQQNKILDEKWAYDKENREMKWQQLNADRQWAIEGLRKKERNELAVKIWKDKTNAASYNQKLQIRNREQASLNMQFGKSEFLFNEQVGFNERSAQNAIESEWRQLDEINSEAAFDSQDKRLAYLQAEGEMRAKGVSGRSAGKSHQAAMANFGSQVAAMNEGIASAGRNTRAMIKQISDDKFSANLAAYAQRMLPPGELPMPIKPFETPLAEFQGPRPLNRAFDLGPEPVRGGYYSPNLAAQAAWGAAIPGIASTVGDLASDIFSD